jgi:hypothetical protein
VPRRSLAERKETRERDVAPFLELFKDQYDQKVGFAGSLLSTYTAVLTSPGFLFVEESPGELDDHALATRLALFLWNSAPDERLRELARRGKISEPDVLRAETERLIDDPKARRFAEAFTFARRRSWAANLAHPSTGSPWRHSPTRSPVYTPTWAHRRDLARGHAGDHSSGWVR